MSFLFGLTVLGYAMPIVGLYAIRSPESTAVDGKSSADLKKSCCQMKKRVVRALALLLSMKTRFSYIVNY